MMFSVVLIGLNESKHLKESIICIKKALKKIDNDGEIIFVDSGSNDNSVEIALKEGITVIEIRAPRPNASICRNIGAKYARGKYINFIDADIYMDEDWLFEARKLLLELPEVSMVCGQLNEKDGDNNLIKYFASWTERKIGYLEYPIGGGGIIKKEDFLKISGYNINLLRGQETEFGYRLRMAGYKIYGIPQIMGVHHLEAGGVKSFIKRVKRMALSYTYNLLDKEYNLMEGIFYRQAKKNIIVGILLFEVIILWFMVVILNGYIALILLVLFLLANVFYLIIKRKNFLFLFEKYSIIVFQLYFKFKFFFKSNQRNELKNIVIKVYNN